MAGDLDPAARFPDNQDDVNRRINESISRLHAELGKAKQRQEEGKRLLEEASKGGVPDTERSTPEAACYVGNPSTLQPRVCASPPRAASPSTKLSISPARRSEGRAVMEVRQPPRIISAVPQAAAPRRHKPVRPASPTHRPTINRSGPYAGIPSRYQDPKRPPTPPPEGMRLDPMLEGHSRMVQ
eukprot:Sspe_Gene.75522::Locus_47182_Transcript_1_1_Confidence_1.000_Length_597::g.75522::m.75522